MILFYIYPIGTGHQTTRSEQSATKAAKHHYKRAKGAGGERGEVQRGAACSWRLNRGAEANRRSGATGPGVRPRALDAMRQGGAGSA